MQDMVLFFHALAVLALQEVVVRELLIVHLPCGGILHLLMHAHDVRVMLSQHPVVRTTHRALLPALLLAAEVLPYGPFPHRGSIRMDKPAVLGLFTHFLLHLVL